MEIAVLLLAAGCGRRFASELPKQYVCVQGKPLLRHALEHLAAEPRIRWVQPVLAAGDRHYADVVHGLDWPFALLPPVTGGRERSESMQRGLAALPTEAHWVAVHDAARAFPSPRLLAQVFDAALAHGAAVPGMPVHDTIKRVDQARNVIETLPRDALVAVQTPQAARRQWFEQALAQAGTALATFSDDASMLEACGFPVHISEGEAMNRKLTTRDDLAWLNMHLEAQA